MAQDPSSATIPLSRFVDGLQASGRYTFTRAEVEQNTLHSRPAVESALRRLRAHGRIVTPRRGFHVIVPIEYRNAGSPPASWFIEDFMRFLDQPYYVGLLTAAALHGAAHQQPMVFQVVTDRPTRKARAGREQISFHVARNFALIPISNIQTETGTMKISTPEATAFDLVRYSTAAGHLSHVATVLKELAEHLSPTKLVQLASHHALPDVQRLGFLMDLVGESSRVQGLAEWLTNRRVRPVLLGRGRARGTSAPDSRWRVRKNVSIDLDQ